MTFEQLEKNVKDLISLNQLNEAIHLLDDFFKDDADIDQIIIQSANYRSIVDGQIKGLKDNREVDLALNQLRANILQLLRSKKEYLKYKELTFGPTYTHTESGSDKIKVFFSVGSPFNDSQQHYINKLVDYFDKNGILLETLKGWNDNDPLIPILEEMKTSNGCLVLALERYHIQDGSEKRGSAQETKITDKSLTSSWLHIETALARSLDLPLIILKDRSLKNEGLIHDDKQEWGIVRIDQHNIKEIEEYPIKNFILSWINQVKKYQSSRNRG
jgi:hypothetical protein